MTDGVYLRFCDDDGETAVAGFASAVDALAWASAWDGETERVDPAEVRLGDAVVPPSIEGVDVDAAENVTVSVVRECSGCGFRQTGGRGETVLCCPECGGRSWRVLQGGPVAASTNSGP